MYRCWSWHGHLLYVGKGFDGAKDREKAHRAKRWGKHIARFDWKPCCFAGHATEDESEAHAFVIEAEAIRGECPLLNEVHNGSRGSENKRALAELERKRSLR